MHWFCLLLTLLYWGNAHGLVSYEGHSVLRIAVENEDQAQYLRQHEGDYDFWRSIRIGYWTDIRIPPSDDLPKSLEQYGFKFHTMITDVQELLDRQTKSKSKQQPGDWWEAYHDLEAINAKIDELVAGSPYASSEEMGHSYEGNGMRIVKVCIAECGTVNNAMYVQGGIHAREWIAPAVVTWMINELLKAENIDQYVQNLDWYFLTNVNPDGYDYTWTNDRLWRKTRQPNEGSSCIGTDGNRNFEVGWGLSGPSLLPCSDTYHGSAPFSANETRNVRDFVITNNQFIKFFNDIHSYSQLILLPYAYTNETSPDLNQQMMAAAEAEAALATAHGYHYVYGPHFETIYPAYGTTLDWAYVQLGIVYSMIMELRDTGEYGFLLPPEQIIPTAEEVWEFHKVYANKVMQMP